MSPPEVAAFRAEPYAETAVLLRRCDDGAKVKDLPTPDLEHFVPFLAQCHIQSSVDIPPSARDRPVS
jgi:predicted HD phosphohydrolase